jgi:hypothetical protein
VKIRKPQKGDYSVSKFCYIQSNQSIRFNDQLNEQHHIFRNARGLEGTCERP